MPETNLTEHTRKYFLIKELLNFIHCLAGTVNETFVDPNHKGEDTANIQIILIKFDDFLFLKDLLEYIFTIRDERIIGDVPIKPKVF